MPGAPPLYAHPPEGCEPPVLPLKAPTQGLQVPLTDPRIFRVFARVGQGYGYEPPFEGPEGAPVDAGEASEEVPAAYPREASYPPPGTSVMTCTRTGPIPDTVVLEGEPETDPPTAEEM